MDLFLILANEWPDSASQYINNRILNIVILAIRNALLQRFNVVINCLRRAKLLWNIDLKAICIMIFEMILIDCLRSDKLCFIHKAFTIAFASNMVLNVRIILVVFSQLIDKSLITAIIS